MNKKPHTKASSRRLSHTSWFTLPLAPAEISGNETAVTESQDGTIVRCGSCGKETKYRLKFSQGPRGAMRLQVCPNCKALYFKKDEVVV